MFLLNGPVVSFNNSVIMLLINTWIKVQIELTLNVIYLFQTCIIDEYSHWDLRIWLFKNLNDR